MMDEPLLGPDPSVGGNFVEGEKEEVENVWGMDRHPPHVSPKFDLERYIAQKVVEKVGEGPIPPVGPTTAKQDAPGNPRMRRSGLTGGQKSTSYQKKYVNM
ncbi:hypothetical protein N7448_008461 [Penicillium atrosanguineum]|nr:hypothetical protein N7448_008461 [Penicillium atrosanguineum]